MDVIEIFEIRAQEDGEFIGCCEVLRGHSLAELWDADGTFHTYLTVQNLYGEELYRTIVSVFCTHTECEHSDIYLTDNDNTRILWAE